MVAASPAGAIETRAPDIAEVTATPPQAVIEIIEEAPTEAALPADIVQADAAEEVLAVVTDAEPVATEVATTEVVSEAVALPETIAAAASVAAPADTPLSRAEQLRGLFDTARTDAAIAPAPAQDNAATGVERNA